MRHITLSLFLLTVSTLLAQERELIDMNFDWEFSRDSLFTDSRKIDVPHDFQIEQPWATSSAREQEFAINYNSRLGLRGFKEMGTGWYRKTLVADKSWKGRRVLLDFEGIMLVGDVYLNGERIGGTDYGYLGFEIDIANRLRYEKENTIVVRAPDGIPVVDCSGRSVL